MRKTRSDCRPAMLPPAQREMLHGWFSENLGFAEIAQRCQAQFGVTFSRTSLSTYYARWGREQIAIQAARLDARQPSKP